MTREPVWTGRGSSSPPPSNAAPAKTMVSTMNRSSCLPLHLRRGCRMANIVSETGGCGFSECSCRPNLGPRECAGSGRHPDVLPWVEPADSPASEPRADLLCHPCHVHSVEVGRVYMNDLIFSEHGLVRRLVVLGTIHTESRFDFMYLAA